MIQQFLMTSNIFGVRSNRSDRPDLPHFGSIPTTDPLVDPLVDIREVRQGNPLEHRVVVRNLHLHVVEHHIQEMPFCFKLCHLLNISDYM